MNNINGKNWYKEVASNSNEKELERTKFYEKRAILKDAISVDLKLKELNDVLVNKESAYLFGILESTFGMKSAYKILKIASRKGSGFNVDLFQKGDTVGIKNESGAYYLIKKNSNGDILEKTQISFDQEVKNVKENANPGEENFNLAFNVAKTIFANSGVKVSKINFPREGEFGFNLEYGAKKEMVKIIHNDSIESDQYFRPNTYSAFFKDQKYSTYGGAVKEAGLSLLPKTQDQVVIDENLPVLDQWNLWEARLVYLCNKENVKLNVIDRKNGNKHLVLTKNGQNLTIRIIKNKFVKQKDWNSYSVRIVYKGLNYSNPELAIKKAILDFAEPKIQKVRSPFERKIHTHGIIGEDDQHEGHTH